MSGEGICKHGNTFFNKENWCEECFEEGYNSAKLSSEDISSAISLGMRDGELYLEEIPKVLSLIKTLWGHREHFNEEERKFMMDLYDKKAKEIGLPNLQTKLLNDIMELVKNDKP